MPRPCFCDECSGSRTKTYTMSINPLTGQPQLTPVSGGLNGLSGLNGLNGVNGLTGVNSGLTGINGLGGLGGLGGLTGVNGLTGVTGNGVSTTIGTTFGRTVGTGVVTRSGGNTFVTLPVQNGYLDHPLIDLTQD